MEAYIQTNDPRMVEIVARTNQLLNRWYKIIREAKIADPYGTRDKKLTLYIDQETAYEFRLLDCGPLVIGLTMAPRYRDTTLFGHPLELIEVLSSGDRYDHLCFV